MSEQPTPPAGPATGPLARVQAVIAWAMQTRPVRVFLHYGARRGPILASGLAYQALFAVFAGLLVGFSIAGAVIRDNLGLRRALIDTLSESVPGLIDDGSGGAVRPDQLLDASIIGWTGAIAAAALLVTALGWLASARDSVRAVFDLPPQAGNFLLLKLKDLGLAVGFGVALLVSAVLSVVGSSATEWLLGLIGVDAESPLAIVLGRVVTLAIMFALDAVVLAALFRVLSGVEIPIARLRGGALLGAAGLGVLKVLGSSLLGGASNNPLLASFAVILGLLIFFNFVCQVILIAASWTAVGLADRDYVIDAGVAESRLREAVETLESKGLAVGVPTARRGGRTRIERVDPRA